MNFADTADELYGLHPNDFTAARNAAAKRAATPGQLLGLRKPTPAAWVVNLRMRHRTAAIDEALDLGAQLQAAQADLDREALTELSKQRRQLVAALARQGAELAELQGHPVSAAAIDEVARTLQAALADPDAAAAVRTGRLVRALETVGLTVDLEGAVAGDFAPLRPSLHVVDELEEKRAEHRRRAAEAQRALEAAETAHQAAARRVADAMRRRDAIADDVASAQATLKSLKSSLAEAERELKSLVADRFRAEAAADAARLGTES